MDKDNSSTTSRLAAHTFGDQYDRNSSLEYVENKQELHQQNSKVTNEVDNIMIRSDFSDEKEGESEYDKMFVNIIQKACEALKESRNNASTQFQRNRFDSERSKIDILIEWIYHCVCRGYYLTAKNASNDVLTHIEHIMQVLKTDSKQTAWKKSQFKTLKCIQAYISLLIIFIVKKLQPNSSIYDNYEESNEFSIIVANIRKITKFVKINEFTKQISKICRKINKLDDHDMFCKYNLKIKEIKELQEYKQLCDPTRANQMSDLPKIVEYFVDKLNGKKTANRETKSNANMMYPSLNTVMNISEPVLKIRRPSSHIMTSRPKMQKLSMPLYCGTSKNQALRNNDKMHQMSSAHLNDNFKFIVEDKI